MPQKIESDEKNAHRLAISYGAMMPQSDGNH